MGSPQSNLEIGCSTHPREIFYAFMAKLVRHLTSNEEIVSSNLAEGNCFFAKFLQHLLIKPEFSSKGSLTGRIVQRFIMKIFLTLR